MYTYDDVLNALHDLEKKNPKVLNIPFEDNKLGKEQMIDEEVSYELDTKRYKTDVMSRDCYLRSKQESQNLRNILKRKCRNYKSVKTPITYGLCFYESVLISTYECYITTMSNCSHRSKESFSVFIFHFKTEF